MLFTTFNPFFGYGASVASIEVLELGKHLKKHLNKVLFIRRFEIMSNTFPKYYDFFMGPLENHQQIFGITV